MASHEWERRTPGNGYAWTCARCGNSVESHLRPWDQTPFQPYVLTFLPADDAHPAGWVPDSSVLSDCDQALVQEVLDS